MADEGLREALARIEKAREIGADGLKLDELGLKVLPPEVCQLSKLTSLSLNRNELTTLPPEIGLLTNLTKLWVHSNKLSSLPAEIGQLTNLTELWLHSNQLSSLLPEIGLLSELNMLWLHDNQLTRLPAEIGQLSMLSVLWLHGNQLTRLPAEIGQLSMLSVLWLQENQLTRLPPEIGQLSMLTGLHLASNPLSFPPVEIRTGGIMAIRSFLKTYSLKKIDRYEGKLLILGDGGEGKTCLSRSLRGLSFDEQETTHGVAVCPWTFENPVAPNSFNSITLNVWDFEGQEINHQSHQFFLTKRSLYLLVFKGREHIQLSRLEYWLDTIRHRAPGCNTLLVATECEGRTPSFPVDRLVSEYSEILPEHPFYPVDSKSGRNIDELRSRIMRLAEGMELMPQPWPAAYQNAEKSLMELGKQTNYVKRAALEGIFEEKGLPADAFDSTARVFGDLGIFTHFPDNPDMKDRIVLNPQWLTKAISLALEVPSLSAQGGEMDHHCLEVAWEKEYAGHHLFFHACMKHFELCYPLENCDNMSLVPLRFPYERPSIPWVESPGARERRVEYHFTGNPPAGLISRFIVKTHHLIVKPKDRLKGVFWRHGVFLEIRETYYRVQALCELNVEARFLRFTVKAAYPQNFIAQLDSFACAVFSFFEGFEPTRYFGCIHEDERPCSGSFDDSNVMFHFEKNQSLLCPKENHEITPRQLLHGLHGFAPSDEEEKGIQAILARMDEQKEGIAQIYAGQQPSDEVFQRIQQGYHELINLTNSREMAQIPSIATFIPVGFELEDLERMESLSFQLRFWCEHEMHPHHWLWTGTLDMNKDDWRSLCPYLLPVAKVLAMATAPAFSASPLADDLAVAKAEVIASNTACSLLCVETPAREGVEAPHLSNDIFADNAFRLARLEMLRTIRKSFPDETEALNWQGLSRYLLSNNRYRWLCPEHKPD